MRTLILMGLTLCLLSEVGFSGVNAKPRKRLLRVELAQEQVVELTSINEWLDTNLNSEDCPERRYFSIHERTRKARLLGYQVIADCPDAPEPYVSIYFDTEQSVLEGSR